jgi:inward rectifier potassium channel
VFGSRAAFGRVQGAPHLGLRIGNARNNRIFDAQFRLILVRTLREPSEGVLYKSEELQLVQSTASNLQRVWNLLHRIDEKSPLFGATPESLRASEAELHLALSGTDETTLQPVHGRHAWEATSFAWNVRLADVVSETPTGIVVDMRKFDEVVDAPM